MKFFEIFSKNLVFSLKMKKKGRFFQIGPVFICAKNVSGNPYRSVCRRIGLFIFARRLSAVYHLHRSTYRF